MEQNSEEKPAQAVGFTHRFDYLTDDTGIYDGIPRYICRTCGVGVLRNYEYVHIEYHKMRGDYHD